MDGDVRCGIARDVIPAEAGIYGWVFFLKSAVGFLVYSCPGADCDYFYFFLGDAVDYSEPADAIASQARQLFF